MENRKQNEKALRLTPALIRQRVVALTAQSFRAVTSSFAGAARAFDALHRERSKAQTKTRGAVGLFLFCFAVVALSTVIASARFPLGVLPAGFALLAGISVGEGGLFYDLKLAKKDAAALENVALMSVFFGVLLSCLFAERGYFFLLAYLILFMTRAGVTSAKFNDSVLSRVTASAATAVGVGILFSFLDHFSVNSVFAATSYGITTPLFCYLFCGFGMYGGAVPASFPARAKRKGYLAFAAAGSLYLFLYAIRSWEISRFSVSFVVAVIVMLCSARHLGPLYGAAAGLVGGMACSVASLAPSLAVAGFFAGIFFSYSAPVALMISFVAASGYSMYSEGFETFGQFTADYLAGVALFLPLIPLLSGGKRKARMLTPALPRSTATLSARKTLRAMSDTFSSLSEVFYTVTDTMKKPTLSEVSRLVSDVAASLCSDCALSSICWGERQEAGRKASALLAARLLGKGTVSEADLDPAFFADCKKRKEWVDLLGRRFDTLNGNFMKNNKTRLLAGEYSSVSRLLKSTAGELESELEYNPALEARAKKVLAKLDIPYRRVAVFGKRELKIDVYGVSMERIGVRSDKVLEAFESEFHCAFDAPRYLLLEESVILRLVRRRRIALECAKSGCTKKGETVSGDTVCYFETERDYFYTLLCDGMGSGREAAFTSRLASIFIEKLMTCSTPKNVTLEMLNTFLMSKTDETFTTVDLLEIDLLTGEGKFIKAGAAPSYVLRGDRLHRIESRTPPAGVLRKMCAEETRMMLRQGDFVLQISDGAADGDEDAGWLVEILAGMEFENAASLCDVVFRAARNRAEKKDDLSVSVVRVLKAG